MFGSSKYKNAKRNSYNGPRRSGCSTYGLRRARVYSTKIKK